MTDAQPVAQLQKNILKSYFLRIFGWSFIHIPTFVLFLNAHTLSLKDVFLLKAFLSIVVLLLEIPSGYFADVIGRKRSMLLGGLALFISMLLYAAGETLAVFFIAEFFVGVGWSLISGADSALLFDSLIPLKREHEYQKLEGRMLSASSFSEAFGGLLGGFVAAHWLVAPFYLQAFMYFLFIFSVLSLVEPPRIKVPSRQLKLADFGRALKYSLSDHRELAWLIIYNAVVGSATFAVVWFSQPYMEQAGLPVAYFGVVWLVLHLWLGAISFHSAEITEKVGAKNTFIALALLVPIAYSALAFVTSVWGLAVLLVFYFIRGVRTPLVRDYINQRSESDIRATVISTSHFASSLLFAVLSPFLGWLAELYSLSTALYVTGGLYFVLGIIAVRGLQRHKVI